MFASPQLTWIDSPFTEPAILLDLGGLLNGGVVLADAAGLAAATHAIPLTPSLVGLTLWRQAATGLTLPLALSPVAGGVVR